MSGWLKVAHFLGLALFLGSIPGHILLGAVAQPGGDIPPPGIVFAREMVKTATLFVTTPGLLLAVGSGLALAARRGGSPLRTRWLAAHLACGLLMLANALVLIVPAELSLAAQAHALMAGDGFDPAQWRRTELVEGVAGGVNLLLAVTTIAIAVLRPGQRRAATNG